MLNFKDIKYIFKEKGTIISFILVYLILFSNFDNTSSLGKICISIGFISYIILLYLNIKGLYKK